MPVAGDITEITFNHPTLGSGTLFPKSGEDSTIDQGGFRTGDDANMVDGGGRMIKQVNRVRWSVEAPISWDHQLGEDMEKVVAMAADPEDAEWTFTHISGTVYGGTGRPVGDIQGNLNQGTFTLKVSGGGTLKKIA